MLCYVRMYIGSLCFPNMPVDLFLLFLLGVYPEAFELWVKLCAYSCAGLRLHVLLCDLADCVPLQTAKM